MTRRERTLLGGVSAVAIQGRGLLIEGPPGSGKSSLALALIDRGAILIGDDGVQIGLTERGLVAEPPPHTAGLLEIRNVGLVRRPVASATVALVLRLDAKAARYPLDLLETEILGVAVPVLPFAPGDAVQAVRAEYALERHGLSGGAVALQQRLPSCGSECDSASHAGQDAPDCPQDGRKDVQD